MNKKEQAFVYLIDQLIEWHKFLATDGKGILDTFTKLKIIKLLFFATAIDSDKDNELINLFDNFVAMPMGPVESDIYNSINNNRITKYIISDGRLTINNVETPIDQSVESMIDLAISKLKAINLNLILYTAFDLVDLTHRWDCWKITYSYAKANGKGSMPIPANLIRSSDKFFIK